MYETTVRRLTVKIVMNFLAQSTTVLRMECQHVSPSLLLLICTNLDLNYIGSHMACLISLGGAGMTVV